MPTRTVTLNDAHDEMVDHIVAKGRFPSVEAVLDRALELLFEDEMEWDAFLDRINRSYDEALAEPGRTEPAAEALAVRRVFRQARQSYAFQQGPERQSE